jgi:hypothetical protein
VVVLCVEENRREDADALNAAGIATAALSIDGVADVAPALRTLAALVGVDPGRVEDIEMTTPDARGDGRLRAFVPIWKRPWMSLAGGTYGSSLLAAIGVDNVFADADDRYPTVTLDEARARRPDVVLAPSEPYPFRERHVPVLDEVAPVVLVDGQDLFWWGVRTTTFADRRQLTLLEAPPAGRPRHRTGSLSRVLGWHSATTQPPKPAPVTRAPYTPGTPRSLTTSSSSAGVVTSKSSRRLAWLATSSSPA